MRFSLIFQLENSNFPIDKNPCIISFLKKALSEYEKGVYYDKYFAIGAEKNYAFSILLPDAIFQKDKIIISGKKIRVFFSSSDGNTAITFYNAFLNQKNKLFNLPLSNTMTLLKVNMELEKVITSRQIIIQMNSPLCVRIHDRTDNRDVYLESSDLRFEIALRTIISNQVKHDEQITKEMVNEFRCIPLQTQKTVVLHHGQFISSNIGTFGLFANPRLLTHLYMNGMGSRKNGGFGLFQVIKQGGV